jgi:hypothetical protein
MVERINMLLDQMCAKLNKNSMNYSVSIEIFSALGMAGENTHDIVSEALKNPVILRRTDNVDALEILEELSKSLVYTEGESSAVHPNSEFLKSKNFLLLKGEILDCFQTVLQEASQIMSFSIKTGQHPFYPVWWDYGFIIEKDSNAYVLIGSASD